MLCDLVKATPEKLHLIQDYAATRLTGFVLPGQDGVSRLYLSRFPPDAWLDPWRFRIYVASSEGLVDTATAALESEGVAILSTEASVGDALLNGHRGATVRMYCNLIDYGDDNHPDGTTFRRRKETDPQVQALLDCLTIELWPFIEKGRQRPTIRATCLVQLRDIALKARGVAQKPINIPVSQEDGSITIPTEPRRQLLGGDDAQRDWLFLIESAIEDRFIRVTPVDPKRALLLDIVHRYKPGQLGVLSKVLGRQVAQVDVVGLYSYPADSDDLYKTRMILETPGGNAERWRRRVRNAFQAAISHGQLFADDIEDIEFGDPLSAAGGNQEQADNKEQGTSTFFRRWFSMEGGTE